MVSFIPPEGFKFQVYYFGDSDFKAHRGVYSMHRYCFLETTGLQMNGEVDYTPKYPHDGWMCHRGIYSSILEVLYTPGVNAVDPQRSCYCTFHIGVHTVRSPLSPQGKLVDPYTIP